MTILLQHSAIQSILPWLRVWAQHRSTVRGSREASRPGKMGRQLRECSSEERRRMSENQGWDGWENREQPVASSAGDPAHFLAGLFAKLTFLKFIFFQGVAAFPWGTILMETDRA